MNQQVTWTTTVGTIAPIGNTAILTAPATAGTSTVTASYSTLSANALITVVEGFTAVIPDATKWITFNTWDDQLGGLNLTNAQSSLAVNHREWGYGEVWLVNSGDDIAIEDGVEYDIIFDYQGAATSGAISLTSGFADTWDLKTVTVFNATTATINSGFSNSDFTTQVFTVTASYTGKTNVFVQMLWGADPTNNKPSVATTSLIKNLKVIAKKSNPMQSITLAKGWNLVSTYIETTDMSIATVFECAETVKNDSDFFSTSHPYYLNGIGQIEAGNGYLVWTDNGCNALLEGAISYSQTVELQKGWNIVGYPFNTTKDIDVVLSSISGNIISIKDFDGFWIKDGLNSFTQLNPGKAYYINVSDKCTITW